MKQETKDKLLVNATFDVIALFVLIFNGFYYHDLGLSILEFLMFEVLSVLCIIPVFGLGLTIIGQLYYNVAPITPLIIIAWFLIMWVVILEWLGITLRFLAGGLKWIQDL